VSIHPVGDVIEAARTYVEGCYFPPDHAMLNRVRRGPYGSVRCEMEAARGVVSSGPWPAGRTRHNAEGLLEVGAWAPE